VNITYCNDSAGVSQVWYLRNAMTGMAEEPRAPIRSPGRPSLVRGLPLTDGERRSAGVFDVTGRRVQTGRLVTGVYLVRNQQGALRRLLVVR